MANGRRGKATAIVAPSVVVSNPHPLLGTYPPQHWILYGDFGSGFGQNQRAAHGGRTTPF